MLTKSSQNFTQLQLQDDCGCAAITKVTYKKDAPFPILEAFERGVTMGDIRYKSRGKITFESLSCCKTPKNSATADNGCLITSRRELFGTSIPLCCDNTSTTLDDEKIRVLAQAKRDLSVRILTGSGGANGTLGIANHPETVRSNVTTDFDAQQAIFEALFRASGAGTPSVIMSPSMMKALLAGQPTTGSAFTANLTMLNNMLCNACDSAPKIVVSDLIPGKQAFVFPQDDLVYYLSEYEDGMCSNMVESESSSSTWLLMAAIADGFNTMLHFGYAFAGVIGQMQYYTHINYV